MVRIIFFSVFCSVVMFLSCSDYDCCESGDFFKKNYITCYLIPDSIGFDAELTKIHKDSVYLTVEFFGDKASYEWYRHGETIEWFASPLFDSLSCVYGDTAFNMEGSDRDALAYPISAVSIWSDADYDLAHPAGTNLNVVSDISFRSYGEFVSKGYRLSNDRDYGDIEPVPVGFKPILEVSPIEFTLLDYWCYFLRLSLPTSSRLHNITVSTTFTNGLTLSGTIHLDFDSIPINSL